LAASAGSVGEDEYFIDGDDLIVKGWPDARMVLADHWADTFIRPGTNDLEDKYLNIPYLFNGATSKTFGDFFAKLGQEIEFSNNNDGYVYMNRAAQVGRGSESSPIFTFVEGDNCRVKKISASTPPISAAIGSGQCGLMAVSSDWQKSKSTFLEEFIQNTGMDSLELQDSLDQIRSAEPLYQITSEQEQELLQPGDWILIKTKKDGNIPARIKSTLINYHGGTSKFEIQAGRQIRDISTQWGLWKNAHAALDNDHQLTKDAFDFGGPSGSKNFTILASQFKDGDWHARLKISWSLWVASGYEATLPDGINLFLIIKIGGKVIPPGRYKAFGNSGSMDLDISGYCTGSSTSNTVNTVDIKLWGGITPNANYGHKVTGEIAQFKRMAAILNA
jgi:hypothetical protein